MKRIIAFFLLTILVVTVFAGCEKQDSDTTQNDSKPKTIKKGRLLYNDIDLNDFVEIENYEKIVIDTRTSEFSEYFDAVVADDVWEKELYQVLDKEGEVKDGDIVNLDYEGKIGGVAFEGGTAKGYDLEIGSGTFIDDFEEELIGVKVGETRDVTAVFPTPYSNNPDLAGKEAVFTCKINYIRRVMTPEEAYTKMNFGSKEEYVDDITKRAAKNYIQNIISQKAKVKNYPEKDKELLGNDIISYISNIFFQYGDSLEAALAQQGMTVEQYKQIATEEIMKENMIMYYILDTEKLEISKEALDSQQEDLPDSLAESYAVQDIVIDYLYEKVDMK